MPLFPISPNAQESELSSPSRKRTHDEFIDKPIQVSIDEPPDSENISESKSIGLIPSVVNSHLQLSPSQLVKTDATPGSSPAPLTDSSSSPPIRDSPSPNKTPLKPSSISENTMAPKRKLTVAERDQDRTEKRQKKETEAAEKLQKKEAEAAERAKKKAADEEAKAAKAAEKAKKDAAKLAKKAEEDAKKRKKEEEELALKRKKERQQNMLASFVKRAPTTPSKKPAQQASESSPKPDATPSTQEAEPKPQKSAYEQTFQPFFIKSGVTVAPPPFEMDEETKNAKSAILDEHVRGERAEFNPKPFNPAETFNSLFPRSRGIKHPSVRKIMAKLNGDPFDNAFGTGPERTESQAEKLAVNAQDQLNSIPMKYLSFYEDVRPAYCGTVTTPMSATKLRSLARRPIRRAVPTLNYDYDSEAEWVEDDGEDLGDEDDDEEDHEGEEEMDDFLDDSEDLPAATRPAFLGEKEPVSTGICFEDETRLGPSATTHNYRLEIMLDISEPLAGIDPFSSEYWPDTKRAAPKHTVTSASSTSTLMPPPTGPSDAHSKLLPGPSSSAPAVEAKDLVPKDILDDFKKAIASEELREFTKGTIVDLLAKKFSSCTKAQVKTTLDRVAHRVSVPGAKKSVKQWALLPEVAS
ncbi:hypothetical protein M426DRAFT_319193 [Hypoxylon sp. CI-4A]|nr:hypothetical protein M426DRAFT_319193 [Hypoxylon sp. CI-4A]